MESAGVRYLRTRCNSHLVRKYRTSALSMTYSLLPTDVFRVKTSFTYFAETSKLKSGYDLVVSFYLTVQSRLNKT